MDENSFNPHILFYRDRIIAALSRSEMLVKYIELFPVDSPYRIWASAENHNLDIRSIFAECIQKNLFFLRCQRH